jgi:hypothetical protein
MSEEEGQEAWIKQLEDGEEVSAGSKVCGLTAAGRKALIERLQAIIDKRTAKAAAVAAAARGPLQPSGDRGKWSYG